MLLIPAKTLGASAPSAFSAIWMAEYLLSHKGPPVYGNCVQVIPLLLDERRLTGDSAADEGKEEESEEEKQLRDGASQRRVGELTILVLLIGLWLTNQIL
jgi:hypothetical protein